MIQTKIGIVSFRRRRTPIGLNFFIRYFFKFCFVLLGLSFNFQTCEIAEIAWQITDFLLGPWPNQPSTDNFFWDILFCPNGSKKFLAQTNERGQIYFTVYFTQSDRVTESHLFHALYWWLKILCQFLINSPTSFACRETKYIRPLLYYMTFPT